VIAVVVGVALWRQRPQEWLEIPGVQRDLATPPEFRDVLLAIASSARV
jgi:hypothetical protein